MADDGKIESAIGIQKTRRAFVRTAAQVAVTAPAVGLLLSATTKPAAAQTAYQASQLHILDDFTNGNTHEDVDAINCQSNTNCFNGGPTQDDTWTF